MYKTKNKNSFCGTIPGDPPGFIKRFVGFIFMAMVDINSHMSI
jgi:hypothetical protein